MFNYMFDWKSCMMSPKAEKTAWYRKRGRFVF